MGRAAKELRMRRLADHRTERRRRRLSYLMATLGVAVAIALALFLVYFCIDAGLHPWWTRGVPAPEPAAASFPR